MNIPVNPFSFLFCDEQEGNSLAMALPACPTPWPPQAPAPAVGGLPARSRGVAAADRPGDPPAAPELPLPPRPHTPAGKSEQLLSDDRTRWGSGSDFPLTTTTTAAGDRPLPRPQRGRAGRHPPLPAPGRAPRRGPEPRGYNFPLPLQLLLRGPAGGRWRRGAGPSPRPGWQRLPLSAPLSPSPPRRVPPRLRPDEAAAPSSSSAMFQARAPSLTERRSRRRSLPRRRRRRPHRPVPAPPRHLYQTRRSPPHRRGSPARAPRRDLPDSASAPRRPPPRRPSPLRSARRPLLSLSLPVPGRGLGPSP